MKETTSAPEAAQTTGPLDGVRVLELGSFIAGPFAGQLLGDYGAEVIKIETPEDGDPMRRWGIVDQGESLWWPSIARNKQSVALDLRQEAGRDIVRQLARECDVVVENFRPGRLADWNLDYDTLVVDHPELIMVHISGFGRTGPRSTDAGFGSIGEAMGGIRHLTGSPDRPSARAGVSLGDALAALFAVIGATAAIVERHSTGVGQEVDVALYEAVFALMESSLADYEVAGMVRSRTGGVLPGVAPSNVYPTGDGQEVLIAANADSVFARLCAAMGAPELAADNRFADHVSRGVNMVDIDSIIGRWTGTIDSDDLLEILEEHGIPAGRIYTAPDILADPHYAARGVIEQLLTPSGRQVSFPGVVPQFSRTPGSVRSAGPPLGRDTRAVLRSLAGIGDEAWDALCSAGVVRDDIGDIVSSEIPTLATDSG